MGSSVRPTGIATPPNGPNAAPAIDPWNRRYLEQLIAPAADASSVGRQAGPSVGMMPRYRLPRPDGGSRDAYPGQSLVSGATDFLPVVGDIKGAAAGGEALAEGHPFRAAFMLAASALPGLPAGAGKRFYSRLARAIEGAPFTKGTAEQWAAALGKNVAKGEREWTGVDRFLEDNKGKVLNRADVQGAYDRGQVKLGETVLGDQPASPEYWAAATRQNELEPAVGRTVSKLRDQLDAFLATHGPAHRLLFTPRDAQGLAMQLRRTGLAAFPELERAIRAEGFGDWFETLTREAKEALAEYSAAGQARAALDPETAATAAADRASRDYYQALATMHNKLEALGVDQVTRANVAQYAARGLSVDAMLARNPLIEGARAEIEAVTAATAESQRANDALSKVKRPRAKFEQYTVKPTGENYREHLIQLEKDGDPLGDHVVALRDRERELRSELDRLSNEYQTAETTDVTSDQLQGIRTELGQLARQRSHAENALRGSTFVVPDHWDDTPNILAHLRLSDREAGAGGMGDKTLFIEELQSDWHQRGLKKGYKPRPSLEQFARLDALEGERYQAGREYEYARDAYQRQRERIYNRQAAGLLTNADQASHDAALGAMKAASDRFDALNAEVDKLRGPYEGVPDAPFKKTEDWAGLGFRRALDEAARGDYDRLAWATGQQNADHYDLSKQIDALDYDPVSSELRAWKGGGIMHRGRYDAKALPSVVGKEAADKLLAAPLGTDPRDWGPGASRGLHRLEGLDLAIGGHGMRAFYDQIIPGIARDTGKRLGVPIEIEPTQIVGGALRQGDIGRVAKELHNAGEPAMSRLVKQIDATLADNGARDADWRTALEEIRRSAADPNIGELLPEDAEMLHPVVIGDVTRYLDQLEQRQQIMNQSIRITPELRKRILESGLPMWAGVGAVGLGLYGLTPKPEGER